MSKYQYSLSHLVDINRNKYTFDFGILSHFSKSVWQSIYPVLYNDDGEIDTNNFMVYYNTSFNDSLGYEHKNCDLIEDAWCSKHGEMVYYKEFENERDAVDSFVNDCQSSVFLHLNELARMWQVINADYCPLFNKDVTDVRTVKGTLEDVEDIEYFSDDTVGKTEDREQSSDKGSRNGNALTNYTETTQNSVVPENNTNFYDADMSTTTKDVESVDIKSVNNVDYSITHNAENTHTKETDYTETTVSRGNQGVTMSQQMIDAEVKLRMTSAFWDYVYKIVIEPLLMYKI